MMRLLSVTVMLLCASTPASAQNCPAPDTVLLRNLEIVSAQYYRVATLADVRIDSIRPIRDQLIRALRAARDDKASPLRARLSENAGRLVNLALAVPRNVPGPPDTAQAAPAVTDSLRVAQDSVKTLTAELAEAKRKEAEKNPLLLQEMQQLMKESAGELALLVVDLAKRVEALETRTAQDARDHAWRTALALTFEDFSTIRSEALSRDICVHVILRSPPDTKASDSLPLKPQSLPTSHLDDTIIAILPTWIRDSPNAPPTLTPAGGAWHPSVAATALPSFGVGVIRRIEQVAGIANLFAQSHILFELGNEQSVTAELGAGKILGPVGIAAVTAYGAERKFGWGGALVYFTHIASIGLSYVDTHGLGVRVARVAAVRR